MLQLTLNIKKKFKLNNETLIIKNYPPTSICITSPLLRLNSAFKTAPFPDLAFREAVPDGPLALSCLLQCFDLYKYKSFICCTFFRFNSLITCIK